MLKGEKIKIKIKDAALIVHRVLESIPGYGAVHCEQDKFASKKKQNNKPDAQIKAAKTETVNNSYCSKHVKKILGCGAKQKAEKTLYVIYNI